MTEISYEFWFDAAHQFLHQPVGHPYRGLHGHSFRAEVAVRGMPDPATGFVVDFAELEAAGERLRALLDHRFLNEIEAIGNPSLENIARFVWQELAPQFAGLARVSIRRDSQRQCCTYLGEMGEAA
jgi:6-pyruvoyltetrahydropterin/6-carboxytetrahydropterin synthase